MSLQQRMDSWYTWMVKNADPDDQPITREAALRQFVFSAISDFIQENDPVISEWLNTSTEDEVPGLHEWVDEYAERPEGEPSGYQRTGSAA